MKSLTLITKLVIFASVSTILFFGSLYIPNKTTESGLMEKSKTDLKKNEELIYRIVKSYSSQKENNGEWFENLRIEISSIKIGKKGFPFIINSDGTFIIHPKVEGENWKEKPFIKKMLKNKNGFVEYTSPKTGKLKYVAYKYLPEENWIVGTGMWADEYDKIISSSESAMYITLIFSILLFSIFFFYIKNKIIQPIKYFQVKTKEISNGNLEVEFKTNRNDEIGLLAKGLQEMTKSIKNSKLELEKEKRQIEQKVQEAVKYSEEQKEYLANNVEIILKAMEEFAQGDLTIQLPNNYEGTIGDLFNGFNTTVNNLSDMVNRINESVDSTITASTQIASSIIELTSGTEMQNVQINEITTSIDEMINTFSETTQSTTHAAKSAGDTGRLAEEGSIVVRSAVVAMDKIANVVSQAADKVIGLGENSDKIGEIIQVIDEIADQTNLLALNAAIEAARAGEHGRGFAVVADEVRKLAERTTQSTQEISSMIQQIQNDTENVVQTIKEGNNEVEEGKKLANSAGTAIEQIVESTNHVVDEINQVATAGEEQSKISNNVSESINIINNVASESLLGTQQIAEATHHLDFTTNELRSMLEQFKTNKRITYNNSEQNELLSVLFCITIIKIKSSELTPRIFYFHK